MEEIDCSWIKIPHQFFFSRVAGSNCSGKVPKVSTKTLKMETWSLLSCTLEMTVVKSFLVLQAIFIRLPLVSKITASNLSEILSKSN